MGKEEKLFFKIMWGYVIVSITTRLVNALSIAMVLCGLLELFNVNMKLWVIIGAVNVIPYITCKKAAAPLAKAMEEFKEKHAKENGNEHTKH